MVENINNRYGARQNFFWKHPIEELIGNVSFPQMIWLMLRGELPSLDETKLLEAALVGGVDHGPQAPSIAAARMAATCGVGLNNVIATGVNMLGDVHGGAGEQCAELYFDIRDRFENGLSLETATQEGINSWRENMGKLYLDSVIDFTSQQTLALRG